jgi:hypothetical protein
MYWTSNIIQFLFFSSKTFANINFAWVQPACNPWDTYNHCLRGQHCESEVCVPNFSPEFRHLSTSEKKRSLDSSEKSRYAALYTKDGIPQIHIAVLFVKIELEVQAANSIV